MSATTQAPADNQQAPAATVVTPPVSATPPVETPAPAAQTPETPKSTETPVATEIKYELKLPEGSKLSADYIQKVETYAKELGLTNEAAQKVLVRESELAATTEQQLAKEYEDQVKSWQDAATNDKEIGGEKFNENKELAYRALDKFGNPELKAMLKESGYDNHPEVLRAFVRIGKAMSEDRIDTAGTQSGVSAKSAASKLYDHPTSQIK